MIAIILAITAIFSWNPPPEAENVLQTEVQASADGGRSFVLLASVPAPDTSLVIDVPEGVRMRYRAIHYGESAKSPPSVEATALVLDFAQGVDSQYAVIDRIKSAVLPNIILLAVRRADVPWIRIWRGPRDQRGPERVIYQSAVDYNGDGWHDLSDLALALDRGLEATINVLKVYQTPARYEWEE